MLKNLSLNLSQDDYDELLMIDEDDFNLSVSTRQLEIFCEGDSESVLSMLPTPSEIAKISN